MEIYIVDGTYELFRAHFGYPSRKTKEGKEVGALKGYINPVSYTHLTLPTIYSV